MSEKQAKTVSAGNWVGPAPQIADKVETALKRFSPGELIAKAHIPRRELTVPEYDDAVLSLRGLTKAQALELRRDVLKADGSLDRDQLEKLVFQMAVVEPHFTLAEVEALWAASPGAAVERVLSAINDLNGEGDVSRKAAQSLVEGAIKQLEAPDHIEVDIDKLVEQLRTAVAELKGEGPSSKGERPNSFRQ